MSRPAGKKQKEWAKKCQSVVKACLGHRHAWVFREPVDAKALGLNDYFEIIKEPMDLGTVKSNLETGVYEHPDEFERHSRLVFTNAKTYNPPGTDVHVMAQAVEDLFVKKYTEHKPAILAKYEEEQVAAASFVADSAARAPAKSGGKDKDRASTKKLLESMNFSDSRPMSFEEKKQLSSDMNLLSSKKLGKIVEIIHYKHPKLLKQNDSDPEEIEIDIDQIDDATLRALADFVQKSLSSSNNKKRKRAGE